MKTKLSMACLAIAFVVNVYSTMNSVNIGISGNISGKNICINMINKNSIEKSDIDPEPKF